MIQRTAASAIPTSAEVGHALRNRVGDARLQSLRQTVALPTTPRGFLIFMLGLQLVIVGIALQVFLAVQIRTTEVAILEHQSQMELYEKKNAELIWQIATATSLEAVQRRAVQLGFAPQDEPIFATRPRQTGTQAASLEAALEARLESTNNPGDEFTRWAGSASTAPSAPIAVPTPNLDEQWTSGLVTQLRAGTTRLVASWLGTQQ